MSFQARFGLTGTRPNEGHIELGWSDARTELDRDVEIAIELFCDYVIDAYDRICSRPSTGGGRQRRHEASAEPPHSSRN
jgi:hypothetical protein